MSPANRAINGPQSQPGRLWRLGPWLLVLVLSVYQLWSGVVPGWRAIQSDFPNYFVSARLLVRGEDVKKFYDFDWFNQQVKQEGIDQLSNFGPFPPLSAALMVPLTPFEPLTAKRIWLIFNLALMFGVILLVKKISGWNGSWSSVFILSAGGALSMNFKLGQVYLLLLMLLLISYVLEKKGKAGWAGMLLGAITVLKYFPLFMLVVYLYRKNYQIAAAGGLMIVLLVGCQWALFPEATLHYYANVLPAHLSGELPGQGGFAVQFQSWNSLVNNVFVYDPGLNPDPTVNWPPGRNLTLLLLYALALGPATYLLRRLSRTDLRKGLDLSLALAGITLLTLLPATGIYHFLFLPFCLVMLFSTTRKYLGWLVTLYLGLGFIPQHGLSVLGDSLVFSYPRLWIINLMMVLTWLSIVHWVRTYRGNPTL